MTYNPVSRKHFPCNSSVAADINSSSFVICATFGLDLDIPDVYIELRGNGNSDARAPSVTRYTSKAYAILGIIKRNFDHIGKDAFVLLYNNNNNNNNTLIYIAPACRMTSEALADSSSRATECLTEK